MTAALLLILLAGCSKSHSGSVTLTTLTGKWRALSTSGGIAGTTTDFTNELRLLQLNADSTYKVTVNGALFSSGVYSFAIDTIGGFPDSLFTFRSAQTDYVSRQWTHLHDLQLLLSDGPGDGYSTRYIKYQ